MLFIFRVDIGTMINLEMNLALETVAHLQTAIASYCNIPVDKQVPRLDLFKYRVCPSIRFLDKKINNNKFAEK